MSQQCKAIQRKSDIISFSSQLRIVPFSGAHMNPAVTVASAVVKRLPYRKVPVYIAAQMLGAFVASACVYGVYYGQ